MRQYILELLKSINAEIIFDENVNFVEDGIIDSFDIASIVAGFEETFDIEIDGEDIIPENFYDVEAMVKLIEKYTNR